MPDTNLRTSALVAFSSRWCWMRRSSFDLPATGYYHPRDKSNCLCLCKRELVIAISEHSMIASTAASVDKCIRIISFVGGTGSGADYRSSATGILG
ncbi:hypothetical protein KQX54_017378 [Cotesia glomerata]|uniref:Uncharacterized protein n=1 Tax=Cotesia glomerata TaxID=32391 RepID=A0AAV7IFK3_COTGL|nr:hypothetical protein KQX54_017378 [Cotesia glomerata]